MTKHATTVVSNMLRFVRRSTMLLLLSLTMLTTVSAQTSTSGTTPSGLAPGAPAGSYALSGFDNVNVFNGNLNFHLPLLTIGGRGKAGYTMMLTIDSKRWTVHADSVGQTYTPDYYWWTGFKPELSPGVMNARSVGSNPIDCPDFGLPYWYTQTLTRLTFTTADGTEYEFRDALTNGAINVTSFCNPNNLQPLRRGRVWVSGDGSAASFISDSEFYDNPYYVGEFSGPLLANGTYAPISGYLLMRDGTRYRIDNNKVTSIRDANGNKVTVTPTFITDSLNRTFDIATDANGNNTITFKGFNGANRQIKILRAPLSQLLRSDFPLPAKTYQQLFNALSPITTTFDPTLVSAVELPDGRKYEFRYNYYGELAKVTLPTGGSYEYDWRPGLGADLDGIVWYTVGYVTGYENYINVYRRVNEKRVYSSGTTLEGKTVFSTVSESGETDARPWTSVVKVEQEDPGGAVFGASTHFFNGSPKGSFISFPFDYPEWDDGKEYRTDALASNSTTVLRRADQTWQNAPGAPSITNWHPYARKGPPNNPRDVEVLTSLKDVSPNQVSKRTSIDPSTGAVGFDQYNNQTDVWEYDYGQGAPGNVVRHTRTQYLASGYDIVAGTAINPDLASTFHIRSLPKKEWIFSVDPTTGAETQVAKTTLEYDNYLNDGFHAPLSDCPGIIGRESGFGTSYGTRGNVTAVSRWLDTTGGDVTAYSQYDIAGNIVKAIDPRSTTSNIIATTFDFSDRFGTPDGDARLNPGPTNLSIGQTTYGFPTLITNGLGHTVYAQFDFYLGRAVDGEDVNGIKSSGYYNDLLDRPTEVWRNVVGGVAYSKIRFVYDDANRTITTQGDQTTLADFAQQSFIKYDGLGRRIRAAAYEGNTGGGNTWAIVDTQFDGLGRLSQTSNPFRDTSPVTATAPSGIWTTTSYDALSRVLTVTTPDLAVVTTSYSGNMALVTDQATKKRISQTNALGQLTKVWEVLAAADGASVTVTFNAQTYNAYLTTYAYDALDDLKNVSQGTQTQRTFLYDSLKRLTQASNPENSIVNYTYDANSNLFTKTDARSITTTYSYDALNRATKRTYSDSTPEVNYYYDSQTLPAGKPPSFTATNSTGRLVAVCYGGATASAGTYQSYDQLGRVTSSYQQTDAQNYGFTYVYNLANEMTREKYPSGNEIRTTYDVAGRVGDVKRYINDVFDKTYASTISYAAHGVVASMTLGNNLVEKTEFNNRLQPTFIKLGTTGNPISVLQLGYAYGTTTNNGNVLTQTITAPGLTLTECYGYDSLNRLSTAEERSGTICGAGTQQWKQAFSYDRYGNRNFDVANTTANVLGPNPTISQTNNRIAAGQNYGYDNAGNLTSDPSTPVNGILYDAENGQTQYTKTGQGTNYYFYDGDGRRVKKVVGGTTTVFVYNVVGQLIAEYDNSTSPPPSGGTSYLTTDHLGSTRVVTKADGSVKARYDYLPFGEELPSGIGGRTVAMGYSAADSTKQKFTQKERDNESGLDYFLARYYSSAQGRFTSGDQPFAGQREDDPQSWNLYVYVTNNPLRYVDRFGLWKEVAPGVWEWEEGDTWKTLAEKTGISKKELKRAFTGAELGPGLAPVDVNGLLAGTPVQSYASTDITPLFAGVGREMNRRANASMQAIGAFAGGTALVGTGIGAGVFVAGGTGLTTLGLSGSGASTLTASELSVAGLASQLKFTGTAAARYALSGRWVPLQTLAQAILYGTRMADPQGAPGAVKIVQQIFVNGKEYTLEIIYRATDNTILHFLYK